MANNSEVFDLSQKHLVGKIVRTTVGTGRILGIHTPEDSSIITITANDLKENTTRIMDSFATLMADDYISFLGQPVIAVFGPDTESVDVFISKIEVEVNTDAELSVFAEHKTKPFVGTSGDVTKYFTPEANIVESSFQAATDSVNLLSNERVVANFVDETCYIKLATQWPLHVKQTVSYSLGIPESNINITEKNFRADFDQLLLQPSMWAAFCAAAAKKAGCLCELFTPAVTWQPNTNFSRQTVVSDEGKPLAEKISVEADFGAFPFFEEEACYNILAGLIPPYDINATEVTIKINQSANAPASFFGDLGHSAAVMFTEYHFNKLSHKVNKSPYEWRSENLDKVSLISERVRKCLSFDALKSTLDECATDSWFNRNHAVFSQVPFDQRKVSTIASYAKGIGIACAQGISGFSERYPYGGPHGLSITLTDDNKAFISLGFYIPKDTKKIYKNIIVEQLGVEYDKISFIDINESSVMDFGPNVLSRSITVVPKLLLQACTQIQKRLSLGAAKPLIQQVYYRSEKDHALFDTNAFGSIAISCHIDPIKVVPIIDNVTARLKFGKVYDTTILARRIRQTICTTISQICPCAENNCVIDLKVKSNPHLPAGACTSMLRGITASALISAITQALGHAIHFIPIYDKDVISIVQKKRNPEVKDEA